MRVLWAAVVLSVVWCALGSSEPVSVLAGLLGYAAGMLHHGR